MMVFWQERLAILATPKTASTAIESALGGLAAVVIQRPRALKHTDASRFASYWKPYLAQAAGAEFEVAALMRDPKDWLGSWYRDGQRDDVEQDRSTRGISFDDFVHAYCAPGPRPSYADVGSQARFLSPAEGRGADRIFRYEQIEVFLHYLEDRLDCAITLPRVNVPPAVDVQLSQQTEADLRAAMNRDFLLYDSLG